MAKPKEEGFPYCQQDTDIYFDPKIRILLSRFGCDGYCVWDYIKQAAYREHGYFVEWSEERQELAAADLSLSAEKTGLIVAYLLKRSLLISKSFNGITVLTSYGIQKRFQIMAKSSKRDYYERHPEIWLLSEEETLGFIFCTENKNNSGIKADNSGIKADNSGIKRQKYSIVKNSITTTNNRACAREDESEEANGTEETENPALRDFLNDFKNVVIDTTNIYGIDFELLREKFLQSSNYLSDAEKPVSLSWVVKNYPLIIRDKYRDKDKRISDDDCGLTEAERKANEAWFDELEKRVGVPK